MSTNDTYKSISMPSKGLFKDNGSRFIALAYPVESEEEIKEIVSSLKKEYHDARHHCYAYRLGLDGSKWRANDDGEPSGSAGRPILGQIDSAGLSDILVVVVRYFGGTLLGTGGLVRAYTRAAQKAVRRAEILSYSKCVDLTFSIDYSLYDKMTSVISRDGGKVIDTRFTDSVSLKVRTVSGTQDKLISDIELLTKGKSPAVSEEIYDIF